jgi:hypothetical protein
MKDDKRKVIETKVTTKSTNVRSVPWCKSRYGSDFKPKQVVGLVEKVEYIWKPDIGPTQCYVRASFDFGYNNVKSMRIHMSQLKLFLEKEQQKDPPNVLIFTAILPTFVIVFSSKSKLQVFRYK